MVRLEKLLATGPVEDSKSKLYAVFDNGKYRKVRPNKFVSILRQWESRGRNLPTDEAFFVIKKMSSDDHSDGSSESIESLRKRSIPNYNPNAWKTDWRESQEVRFLAAGGKVFTLTPNNNSCKLSVSDGLIPVIKNPLEVAQVLMTALFHLANQTGVVQFDLDDFVRLNYEFLNREEPTTQTDDDHDCGKCELLGEVILESSIIPPEVSAKIDADEAEKKRIRSENSRRASNIRWERVRREKEDAGGGQA